MADETNICDTCGDGVVELLRKILSTERDNFDRLAQINQSIAGGDLSTENSNITGINGVAPSVNCGTADAGTLRVAQATDCNVQAVGNIADDSVDSGNPIKIGGIAKTAPTTAVANLDRVNAMFDKFGRLVTQNGIRDVRAQQITTITSSVAETTIVTADATYMRDLYGLILTNTSTTPTSVAIKDATAGTTRITFMIPAQETRGFMLPACDGHKQTAVNNNWTATCGTSVASVIITAFTVGNPS